MSKPIKIGVGYENDITFFHLRPITQAEENEFLAKFTFEDLSADAKASEEHQVCVDAIAAWSVKVPTKSEKGQEIAISVENAEDPQKAVYEFFETTEQDAQRLSNMLVGNYRSKLLPKVVF